MILPFIEQVNAYNQFNMRGQRYCGAHWGIDPTTLAEIPMPSYLCPSDPTPTGIFTNWLGATASAAYASNYGAISTVFGTSYERSFAGTSGAGQKVPAMGYGGLPTMPNEIKNYSDGLSNTAMVAEIFRGKTIEVRNAHCPSFVTAIALTDGSYCGTLDPSPVTQWLPQSRCGIWTLEAGLACNLDATRAPNSKRPDSYYYAGAGPGGPGTYLHWDGAIPASSAHAGGVLAVYGDGAVHFVSDSVNLPVWRATVSYGGIGPLGAESNTVINE